MVDMERLQSTQQGLENATDHARSYWQALADEAIAHHEYGTLPLEIVPQDMLCQVPALPDAPVDMYKIPLGRSSTLKGLFTAGTSTMQPTDGAICGVSDTVKTSRGSLLMGVQEPVPCTWSGASFASSEGEKRPNYVGVLSLAWSYILSVRLLELQQHEGSKIAYTDSRANECLSIKVRVAKSVPGVNVGNIDAYAARWWAAILAPGQGWKAIVTEQKGEAYITPWSLSLENDVHVDIIWGGSGCISHDPIHPPPSWTALEFLVEFCLLHDLGSQFYAAFAAALNYPTHSHYKRVVDLPFPVGCRSQQVAPTQSDMTEWLAIYKELPYYLSLSCNFNIVMSSLCGSFWELDMPCNLVSPWLHAVLSELPLRSEMVNNPGRYAEIIALMCGIRRPRIAALWIGAAISGLMPKVIDLVKRGTPPLDPNGYAWTGCPQTFMDLAGSGPYFRDGSSSGRMIRRIDLWRLLYLPVIENDGLYYENLPPSPWAPVGESRETNCVLRGLQHRECPRHHLIYQYWTWHLQDRSKVQDKGYRPVEPKDCPGGLFIRPKTKNSDTHPTVPLSQDQEASHEASMAVFEWVLANYDGKAPSEPIYDDDWLAPCIYDDGSDHDMESGTW